MPKCVNPAHLFLGSPAENSADRDNKGRLPLGSASKVAKLNADAVREIRQMLHAGEEQREIGKKFGVSGHAVWLISVGKTWTHVA